MEPPPEFRLLRATNVAAQVAISTTYISRLIESGELPAGRISSGVIRVRLSDLAESISAHVEGFSNGY